MRHELPIAQLRWDPTPIPKEDMTFLHGRADHDHGGRRQHPGRHGGARLSHHQIDGRSALLQCRRRDAVRGRSRAICASSPSSAVIDIEPGEIVRDPARREIPRRDCSTARRAAISARTTAAPSRCRSAGRSAPIASPMRAISSRRSPPTRTRTRRPSCIVKWGGELFKTDAAAFADRRGGLARQLRALQIRPAHLLAGRRHRLRPSRSVDLHGADLAVGNRRAPPTSTS